MTPTASPQAYHKTPKTREARHPEIIAFMHAYFDKHGKVPDAEVVIANTPARHGSELSRVREILFSRGELIGKGRWCKMVKPK